jgi:tetratricopeptide (TPR) repeat protein
MRSIKVEWIPEFSRLSRCFILPAMMLGICLAGGCAADSGARQPLDDGEAALRTAQKDQAMDNTLAAAQTRMMQYDRAIHDADQVLNSGDTSSAAEAYYLRGRALESRPKFDDASRARDLSEARKAYSDGLTYSPSKALEGRLHTQLGNIAYLQDDYAAALVQWTQAYAQLDRPEWKRWVLYYMGSCQQRLGRFADADRTFERLEQQYAGSDAAEQGRKLEGVHAFYVQVGAFTKPADAEHAAAAISAAGSVAMKTTQNGLVIIRSMDIPSYALAVTLRNQLWSKYPDAKILP